MPKEHAELIVWVRDNSPITENTPGRAAATEQLKLFRSEHIKTVSFQNRDSYRIKIVRYRYSSSVKLVDQQEPAPEVPRS